MKISKFAMLAGAALSVGSVAMAQNADQDRAYAAELQADASVRSSELGAASKGMMIGDGANTLRIGGSVITRYNMNFRSKDTMANGGADNKGFAHGFSIPLVHINMGGNVATEGLTYFIQGAFSDLGGSSTGGGSDGFFLEDAFIDYNYGNGFSIRGGQFKFGFDRNTSIDNELLLIPNWYAIGSAFFSQGRSQGIQGTYSADQWRVMFGFSDGANQLNTNFNAATESDYALNVRGEWQAIGAPNWAIWNYDTSFRSQADMALLIGAGLEFQGTGNTGAVGGMTLPDQDVIAYTLDATLKDAGWHVSAALHGRHISQSGAGSNDLDDFGGFVQAGVFVADQWELFARLDAIFPDDNYAGTGGDVDDSWFITAGVNYYLVPESHAAIINAAVTYAFEDTAGPNPGPVGVGGGTSVPGSLNGLNLANGSVGYLGDADDGEIGVAVTAQVKF